VNVRVRHLQDLCLAETVQTDLVQVDQAIEISW
jgi:hypothetical protein